MEGLTRGQTVKVYQDPITCKELEGEATLKEPVDIGTGDDNYEWWLVEFPGDYGYACQRKINLSNC